MAKSISLTIDGMQVQVPEGTLIVDAARQIGVEIPVFCHHPKLEPVGMCRMCLVEIGRPVRDRISGDLILEADGAPKILFGPKLETACTTPVSEGMVVRGMTEKVNAAREDVIEFLLTSHPLDCPICDKGGECPLQNLTMGYGPGESRYLYEEKKRLAKRLPLGELIYLDRERCIQCARCVRFQEEVADDPVIGFTNRGRSLEIVTYSQPGFDSYFSGNTTDICPVGALTSADFRFSARPWELKSAASICPHCPVGCNTTLNVRREAAGGGEWVVKRVMPRQNEAVNEIWICDKGRFAHHYARSQQRLSEPLVRKNGVLTPASWEEALDVVAERFRQAGQGLLTLASGRLSNEDLFNLWALADGLGGRAVLYSTMAGGDLIAEVGLGQGTNLGELDPETAILVVASDLQEEAPLWFLRVKGAADRGAKLIVANPRATKLERYAAEVVRYPYGSEAAAVLAMVNTLSAKRPDLPAMVRELSRSPELKAAAKIFSRAENGLILFGSEGAGLESSAALAQACKNLLMVTGHIGRANNGLIAVWERANDQGAWDMGFCPTPDLKAAMQTAAALYVVAADPAGDDPEMAETTDFLVVQDLFLTATAKLADVVLPAQAFLEREGSYTSGERRVQRFYPAVPARPGARADFAISAQIGRRLGIQMEDHLASRVMDHIAAQISDYTGVTYLKLAETEPQWPIVGRDDLYYGGTIYENTQGLGLQLAPAAQRGQPVALGWQEPPEIEMPKIGLLGVPITRLYDQGYTLSASQLLQERIPQPYIALHPAEAETRRIPAGSRVQVRMNGSTTMVTLMLDERVPPGVALVPRSMGIPILGPASIDIRAIERSLP